jgi:hypothetical protein
VGSPSGPNDGYFIQHLSDHLVAAGRETEFISLLRGPRWLEVKSAGGITVL